MRRHLLLALCAGLAVGLLGFLAAGRAEAHGVQVAADPPPNTQLSETPATISVTFSEGIEPSVSTIQLWDQAANPIELGALDFPAPDTMSIQVPGDLAPGIYTVIWRNLSTVDGHTWSGSYPFTMLGPGGAVPEGSVSPKLQTIAQAPSTNPSTLESVARWVVLLGSAVMMGGTAYVLFVAAPAARVLSTDTRNTLRRLSRTVLLITVAIAAFFVLEGSLLELVVQADRLGGLDKADNLLRDTRLGHYLVARQALLGVALLAVVLVWRLRDTFGEGFALGLLFLVSFGVLLTQSLVSHSAASDGAFWTTTVDLLHLSAAALWIGALIHIGLAMPRWLDELKGAPRTLFAAESFRRFSVLAAFSVVVLLASGVLSALVQFTAWDELWSTNYGWSLIGKMAVMMPLLAVAGLNAFILQPRVVQASMQIAGGADGDDSGGVTPAVSQLQHLLSNTVRAEAVLGIMVLVAVGVLIQLQSPRTTAKAESGQVAAAATPEPAGSQDESGYREDTEVNSVIFLLRIDPAHVGENAFELGLGAEGGSVGEITDVRLEFVHEGGDIGDSRLPMTLSGSARYSANGSNLSLPGEWTVTANVRRRNADDLRASFTVPVGEQAPAGGDGGAPAAQAAEESNSIWQWPFNGARSAAAIALLAAVGSGGAAWGAWRLARRRA